MTWPPAAHIDPDTLVYAVGDVHGRSDLLLRLHRMILEDAESRTQRRRYIVFLGDYLDRGPDSAGVIDFLTRTAGADDGFERIFLMGNHDACAIDFLEGRDDGLWWINRLGGAQTLLSYNVAPGTGTGRQLRHAMPEHHRAFLHSLKLHQVIDGVLFVHAGIRPGVALHDQDPEDLLWIREEFLDSPGDHGWLVVHGHTISWDGPDIRANRIGIDTGAVITDVLTALVLSRGDARFLRTP